jgi:signal peptidase II
MQAARGTSLSRVDSSPTAGSPARRRVLGVLAAVFAVVYALDQVTKALAVGRLDPEVPRRFLGHVLELHLTRNAGAAFSTGTTYTVLFSCLAAAACVVVLWLTRRVRSTTWAVAFGLLLAGVGGNLTDRLVRSPAPLRGRVVDFLELPHWPIFNVADMSINLAAAVILVQAYRGVRLDGSRAGVSPEAPDSPSGAADSPES